LTKVDKVKVGQKYKKHRVKLTKVEKTTKVGQKL